MLIKPHSINNKIRAKNKKEKDKSKEIFLLFNSVICFKESINFSEVSAPKYNPDVLSAICFNCPSSILDFTSTPMNDPPS